MGHHACLMLTVSLITMIFYYHPSTTSATLFFRTVPIMPEGTGRVAEVYVDCQRARQARGRLFRLDSAKQEAALRKRPSARSPRSMPPCWRRRPNRHGGRPDPGGQGALQQAQDELDVKSELQRRNPASCRNARSKGCRCCRRAPGRARRGDRCQAIGDDRGIDALLPAEKASAEAKLAEAQVDLDKTVGARRRRRAGRAVRAAAGRRRQPDDAAGRRSDSGGRGPTRSAWPGSARSRRR